MGLCSNMSGFCYFCCCCLSGTLAGVEFCLRVYDALNVDENWGGMGLFGWTT